jgi:3-oxoacyl-[acyl-carrier-protein] synthase II
MIGHLIGAAAAVSAVSTVLSIGHGRVAPTINLEDPDPDCDLDYVPGISRALNLRKALVNSFGFGGHCVTLAVSQFGSASGGNG